MLFLPSSPLRSLLRPPAAASAWLLALVGCVTGLGCGSSPPIAEVVDESGQTWARLSSDESVLAPVKEHGEWMSCVTLRVEHAEDRSTIELVELSCAAPCTQREARDAAPAPLAAAEGALECETTVSLRQSAHWLGFGCTDVDQGTCRALVQRLMSGRTSEQNAVGGRGWGI